MTSSNSFSIYRRFLAALIVVALLLGSLPFTVYAEDVVIDADPAADGSDTGDGEGGGSTGDGTDGDQNADGDPGEAIPVVSENQIEGDGEGAPGDDGEAGDGGDDGDLGEDGEEVTGQQSEVGTSSAGVSTGDATATGEISTTANSNSIQSTTSQPIGDVDTYTLNATGTNQGTIDNTGTTTALTGENSASSTGVSQIETGDAVSVMNIANILNSNIINSTGFMSLLNRMLGDEGIFDLRELFFNNPEALLSASKQCSLMSCAAEDVIYNLLQQNDATINNDVDIYAITGSNEAEGEFAAITTGDAYGAANIINVANTNIIDSNYILMAVNGMGTLNGDLVLPTADLWYAFFGKPNGLSQLEDAEDGTLVDNNQNHAEVNNDLNAVAESGENEAITDLVESVTSTGIAEAASNVLNRVNQNFFGGDSMYMLIRVHGSWSGDVYGLPQGLSWEMTPDGIVIYNTDAEVTPSELLKCGDAYCDVDSYRVHMENQSTSTINNEVDILSLTGDNVLEADVGVIETGDAYAGANVMNIANTNVIGRNWVMAVLNIFGDFNGNISFGAPDLWVGGQLQAESDPVGPGTKVVYTYTIKNNGDITAHDVEFDHEFDSEFMYHLIGGQMANALETASLGDLDPGEELVVTFEGIVDSTVPTGSTTITANARVRSAQSDGNRSDNTEELIVEALNDPAPVEPPPPPPPPTGGGCGSCGGGGGGNPPSNSGGRVLAASVDRMKVDVDPNSPPDIRVYKSVTSKGKTTLLAGEAVDYVVTVKNRGGMAYDAQVVDTLLSPTGSVVSEQSWDLGTIQAGEVIELTYTIEYKADTPTGTYTNKAGVVAYSAPKQSGNKRKKLDIKDATHDLFINGVDLSVRNVSVYGIYRLNDGSYATILTWETSQPSDGQVFWSEKGAVSPYDPLAIQYGYDHASYHLPFFTTKHFMLVYGLEAAKEYTYRIRAAGQGHVAFGGDYTFSTPGFVAKATTTESVTVGATAE